MTTERKLTFRQRELLTEALRRWQNFGPPHTGGDTLTTAWTGLGYASQYKPVVDAGLMEFIGKYEKRCLGWLRLTEAGAAIVQQWIDDGVSVPIDW